MRKQAVGWPIVLCLLGGCFCIATWNDDNARGQDPPAEAADGTNHGAAAGDAAAAMKKFEYVAVVECVRCHTVPGPLDDTDFVKLNEFSVWMTQDKHARSYLKIIPDVDHYNEMKDKFNRIQDDVVSRVVAAGDTDFKKVKDEEWGESNELSARMCDKLGIDKKDFINAQQCLSCHANWQTGNDRPPFVERAGLGVSCQACHGPASEWFQVDNHQNPDKWRPMDPQVKQKEFGMIDVRHPAIRTSQCTSCHVGSPEEGKVLTHEMFAAGHPPLPSFEVESFAQQMPPHWRSLKKKLAEREFKHWETYAEHQNWSPDDLASSKSAILGGVASQRDFLQLLAAQAADSEQIWPQFSMYDCASCHHDLQKDSVRQAVGYGDRRPGRPWIHRWPQALVDAAITHIGADKTAYDAAMDDLTNVLNDTPFGDRTALAGENSAATKAANWLTANLIDKIEQQPFDAAAAKKVLIQLCGVGLQDIVDYHSGRQVVWAIKVLYNDIASSLPEAKETFETTLKELDEFLELDLPSQPSGDITGQLDEFLNRMKSYDPRWVHEKLQTLAGAIES